MKKKRFVTVLTICCFPCMVTAADTATNAVLGTVASALHPVWHKLDPVSGR